MLRKENKGITLVALVITIIILLILTTISIQALTNTGLFESANKAKLETKRGKISETLGLKTMLEQSNNPGGTAEEIITELCIIRSVRWMNWKRDSLTSRLASSQTA